MRKLIVLILLLTSCVLASNAQKKLILDFSAPKFTNKSKPEEIKKLTESKLNQIDKQLSKINILEEKITFEDVQNTPIKIYYINAELPVKIEYGVTDDIGNFVGVFKLYFLNGMLWYTDQIFAKYLFENDKLKLWMDENWNINEIPKEDFLNREIRINQEVKTLLDFLKSELSKRKKQ